MSANAHLTTSTVQHVLALLRLQTARVADTHITKLWSLYWQRYGQKTGLGPWIMSPER